MSGAFFTERKSKSNTVSFLKQVRVNLLKKVLKRTNIFSLYPPERAHRLPAADQCLPPFLRRGQSDISKVNNGETTEYQTGVAPEGATAPLSGKINNLSGNYADGNKFVYCTNNEYSL